mgnify:CR=1 FL=1
MVGDQLAFDTVGFDGRFPAGAQTLGALDGHFLFQIVIALLALAGPQNFGEGPYQHLVLEMAADFREELLRVRRLVGAEQRAALGMIQDVLDSFAATARTFISTSRGEVQFLLGGIVLGPFQHRAVEGVRHVAVAEDVLAEVVEVALGAHADARFRVRELRGALGGEGDHSESPAPVPSPVNTQLWISTCAVSLVSVTTASLFPNEQR